MHSIITSADVKIYIIQKSKRHTLKYYNMFRITWDPSSGSDELYLIGICRQTPTTHIISTTEPLYVISIKYISSPPDDGSYVIRNMLEYILMCVFYTFI